MSADQKFANMPWIANDEPDVYETDDLPEADQIKNVETNEVEQILPKEIEKTSILAYEARQRFENCKVYSTTADFSDKISGTGKVGYAVESSEYKSNIDNEPGSTLTERFQHLQTEVRQLLDDTEAVKKEASATVSGGELTVEQISALASSLTDQLNNLHLEEVFGPDLDLAGLCAHDVVLQKRMLDQIANFKPKLTQCKDGIPDDRITFELYSKPSDKADAATEKTLEFDRRLQRLEALLGSREVTGIGPGGLVDVAARLSERVSLLQPNYLEQIEARLATLQTKLASITKNPENYVLADADTQNKIADLFEIVKKWNSFSFDVPMIIDRLKDMQALHEQASEFSTSLVNMDMAQKKIDESLATYGSQLKSVRESLSNVLSAFKENTLVIEKALKSS